MSVAQKKLFFLFFTVKATVAQYQLGSEIVTTEPLFRGSDH